jgi:O-antigen/teichoic acid export membrane protein
MIRLVSVGLLSQITVVLAAFIRTPLIIQSLGVEKFGYYAAVIGAWAVLASVGEGFRANLRQISRQKSSLLPSSATSRYFKSLLFVLIALAPTVFILQMANTSNSDSLDWSLLSVIVFLGLAYPFFASAVGLREGRGSYSWFHWCTIVGQIFSIFAVIAIANEGSTHLFALATLAPAFVPGIYAFILSWREKPIAALEYRHSKLSNYYVLVLILETVAFSMDSAIVLTLLGPEAAAEFAVSQRIMVFFSVIPAILAPLIATRGGSKLNAGWLRKVQVRQTLFALVVSIFILLTASMIFSLLSKGLLTFNIWLIVAGCANGVVGTFASTTIQAASSEAVIKARFHAACVLFLVSTGMTYLLLPVMGVSGAFFGTMFGTVTYWALVRRLVGKIE